MRLDKLRGIGATSDVLCHYLIEHFLKVVMTGVFSGEFHITAKSNALTLLMKGSCIA